MRNPRATLRSKAAAVMVVAEASEVPDCPAELLDALGEEPGTWVEALTAVKPVFCAEADAVFMLYEEPVRVVETAATDC